MTNLGIAHGKLGDRNKQKELLERAFEIQEQHHGREHFEVAITLNNMASAYVKLGDHNKEKELFERALAIQEQHYGEAHFEVAKTLYNLALAHGALGDRGNEVQILMKVLPIFERHFGMHHEYCAFLKTVIRNATQELPRAVLQSPEYSAVWNLDMSSRVAQELILRDLPDLESPEDCLSGIYQNPAICVYKCPEGDLQNPVCVVSEDQRYGACCVCERKEAADPQDDTCCVCCIEEDPQDLESCVCCCFSFHWRP